MFIVLNHENFIPGERYSRRKNSLEPIFHKNGDFYIVPQGRPCIRMPLPVLAKFEKLARFMKSIFFSYPLASAYTVEEVTFKSPKRFDGTTSFE